MNGVTLADLDMEDLPLVYANRAFEAMTGYTQEEAIGKNCRFLQGRDQEQPEKIRLHEAITNAKAIEVTLKNNRKMAELFYNHLAVTPLLDSNGRVLYCLGVQYDVTRQVLAEEEIKRLNDRLESLAK